jgi:hypothetical protein
MTYMRLLSVVDVLKIAYCCQEMNVVRRNFFKESIMSSAVNEKKTIENHKITSIYQERRTNMRTCSIFAEESL